MYFTHPRARVMSFSIGNYYFGNPVDRSVESCSPLTEMCVTSDALLLSFLHATLFSSCSDPKPQPLLMANNFVKKTVFGISLETRQLWITTFQKGAKTEKLSKTEANQFIDEALRPCINLQDSDDAAICMHNALMWLKDLLDTRPSSKQGFFQVGVLLCL